MKVFISWSGDKSQKVGLVFREWLPSVIQSLEPYVSSEDIDKGARWSTDIAKELEDSTFGILCVTRDNLHAPWLCFEAGALSKTIDKAFVTPFLFDIKRSEVDGPILQFQSTIFEKDDIKKLIHTLNKACGESGISETMLDKAFEVWYPILENNLNKLKEVDENVDSDILQQNDTHSSEIMEEILELARDNQKLLRNPDSKLSDSIDEVKRGLAAALSQLDRNMDLDERRIPRKYKYMFKEDLMHFVLLECQKQYGFLIALCMFQDYFPWIYNVGKELVDMLRSDADLSVKRQATDDFRRILDFTCGHPLIRELYTRRKDGPVMIKDMQHILMRTLDELELEYTSQNVAQ